VDAVVAQRNADLSAVGAFYDRATFAMEPNVRRTVIDHAYDG